MKTKLIRTTMLAGFTLTMAMLFSPMPVWAATCTWQGGTSGDWNTLDNWSCNAIPGASDIVQFNNGGTITVTGIPAQSIAQLLLANDTTVNLQAGGNNTLTIVGAAGTDLDIPSGSALNMNGATNILTLFLGAGATGSISGNMTCHTAAHKLNANDANSITFNSGAVFTQANGCTGNVFSNSGTANVITFASGSTFVSQAGANPFGLSAPNSKVIFQSDSLYRHEQTQAPSFSGRTYANFELNYPSANISGTGAQTLSIDDLTITQGNLNLGMTGTFNLKGNIFVATGRALVFNPASPATIVFNGASTQTIGGGGTITFQDNQRVTINNANGVWLQQDLRLNNALTLLSGDLNTVGNTLTLGNAATVTGAGDVVGNVRREGPFSPATDYRFNNTNTLINFSSVTNGASPSIVIHLSRSAPIGLAHAIPRLYSITPTDISLYNATLQLGYQDTEIGGLTEANLRAWRRDGTRWVSQASDVETINNYVYASNVNGFSDWALTDIDAATAVTLSTFVAYAETPDLQLLGLGTLVIGLGISIWWQRSRSLS